MRAPFFLAPLKNMILALVMNVEGLMQLLMKQRNGVPWTAEDKALLLPRLRTLAGSLPALAVFSLPGGAVLLPALAWLLDRRRRKKRATAPAAEAPVGRPAAPAGTEERS